MTVLLKLLVEESPDKLSVKFGVLKHTFATTEKHLALLLSTN